jgi:spoIIIJ-associated protein
MESLEVSGKTVDEAVEKGLSQLGLDRTEVDIEVLSVGRPGILGFGGEPARVVLKPLAPSPNARPAQAPSRASAPAPTSTEVPVSGDISDEDVQLAAQVLSDLLRYMSIQAAVSVRPPETPGDGVGLVKAVLDVTGDDLGVLIGRRGDTLSSLQYMVNLIVSHQLKTRTIIGIDVEGYRRRREQALTSLALRMAERVKQTRQPVMLEPMPPNERRIVHLALSDDPAVVTNSVGEGEARKVGIALRR